MATDDSRYDRLEDALQLALAFQGSLTGISLTDIEERFGVKRRTASRLLNAVKRAVGEDQFEFEIGDDRQKRWKLVRQRVEGLFRIDAGDYAALDRARGLADREGDASLVREVDGVASKLRSMSRPDWLRKVDPDLEALTEAQGFAFRAGPRPTVDQAALEVLRHAILTQRSVKVRHRKSPDDRATWQKVGPLGFLYGSQHYLVAFSERRKQVVLFRLARIDQVEELEDSFDGPEGFDLDAYAKRSFGVFQEDAVDVAWRFKPRVAAEAMECTFHPDQTVEENADGSVVVRFRAGGVQEMAWYLLTWGRDVEVLEPKKLRRELVKWATAGLRQHGQDADASVELSSLRGTAGVARPRRGAAKAPAKSAKRGKG